MSAPALGRYGCTGVASTSICHPQIMLAIAGNVLVVLTIAGGVGIGVALFVIAKQDESRAGRVIGCLVAAAAVIQAIYFVTGRRWF